MLHTEVKVNNKMYNQITYIIKEYIYNQKIHLD